MRNDQRATILENYHILVFQLLRSQGGLKEYSNFSFLVFRIRTCCLPGQTHPPKRYCDCSWAFFSFFIATVFPIIDVISFSCGIMIYMVRVARNNVETALNVTNFNNVVMSLMDQLRLARRKKMLVRLQHLYV